MRFAKIINGKLEYAPYEVYEEDGKVIELDTKEKCLQHGYIQVMTKKPYYDSEKYEVVYESFTYDEERNIIYVNYSLREKENAINELQTIYKEEINK